jgi:hypothetical protein
MVELYMLAICPQNINLFLLSPSIGSIECSANLKMNFKTILDLKMCALWGKMCVFTRFSSSIFVYSLRCKNYRLLEKVDWFEATSLSLLGDTFMVVEE